MYRRLFLMRGSTALFLLALLTAVGSLAFAQGPTTIVHLVCPCHGQPFNDVLAELAVAFNAAQDEVEVKLETAAGNYQNYRDTTQVLIAAGTPPDVLHLQNQHGASLTSSLVNLNVYLEREGIDAMSLLIPHAVEGLTVRGHMYSMPIFAQPRTLAYRPDFFQSAGLADPNELEAMGSWNWSTYIDMARRLTLDRNGDGETDQWGTTLTRSRADILAWVRSAGTDMFDRLDEPTQANLTDPKLIDAVTTYLAIKNVYDTVSPSSFPAGNVAMFPSLQPGHIGNYRTLAFEWDIAQIPAGTETRVTHTSFNGVQIAATDPRRQDAAWKWAKYLALDPDAIRALVAGSGRTPALISALQDWLDIVTEPEGRTAFVPAMSYARSDIMSVHINEIDRIWNEEFTPAWEGTEDVASAMIRMNDMMNAVLSQ